VDISIGGLSVDQDREGPDESRIERGRSYSVGYSASYLNHCRRLGLSTNYEYGAVRGGHHRIVAMDDAP
jgi:hypothetical protein